MKEEQNYSQHYQGYEEDILMTPSQLKTQKKSNRATYLEYEKAKQSLENSMTQYIQNHQVSQNEKFELISLLLNTLGYGRSAKVFQNEANQGVSCRNPEKSSNKKHKNQVDKLSINHRIEEIINQNISFDEMLDSLSSTLKQEQEQKMIQELFEQNQTTNVFKNRNLQKAVQTLFPNKQTIIIPVYKCLQIDCLGKGVKFADISPQQNVSILDNENTLMIIGYQNKQEKVLKTKIDQKRHIIGMKWVNSQVIVLLTSNNKILFYNNKLQNIKTIKSHKIPILTHEISLIKNNPTSQSLYILSASKHLLVPIKINIQGNSLSEENLPTFEIQTELIGLTTIKVPHRVTFHRPLNNQTKQTEFNIVTQIEHFYGLSENRKEIVKFDSIVQQAGVIWRCSKQQFIWELKNSECGHFLQVLVVTRQELPQSLNFDVGQVVSFIKMSASGCILQKLAINLSNICKEILIAYKSMPDRLHLLDITSRWLKLNPYWVRCFAHNNFIYYVSLKTGNLLFSQQIQSNQIKILSVSSQNALLYESKGKLIMLSTQENSKRVVTLQQRTTHDIRESLIQRFSRLHGIPQNLLLLLRTLRNNDIELQEISQ